MIAVYIFVISSLCLLLLFAIKKSELSGKAGAWITIRHGADEWVVRATERLEIKIEYLFHLFSKQVIIKGLHKLTLFALRIVRILERKLVRVISLVRGRTDSIITLAERRKASGNLETITRENPTGRDTMPK